MSVNWKAANLLAVLSDEGEKLDVHLDVMAGHLLVKALGVHLADTRAFRQPVQAVPT